MARPGHFALRREAGAPQRGERLVFDLHAMRARPPLAQGLLRGNPFWAAERLFEIGEHCRRERDGFASGNRGGQEGRQTSRGRARQPAPDGVAVDSKPRCRALAWVRLPTGQQIPPLEAGLLVPVMFPLTPLLEIVRRFGHGWHRRAHQVPSRPE